jgi:uncharacterized protein (TIGR02466 family)
LIIENLFPIPIGFFKYDGYVDIDFLNTQPQCSNEYNTSSKDKYLLNHKQLFDLRQFIEKSIHEYFMATYCPKNDTRLKITQSWLNWTKPNQHHHKHAHPNSLISGCYYVNAHKDRDKIFFYRDAYQQIRFPPVEWNLYNSDSWWYPVGTGDIIIFPSSLTHMVRPVEGEDTRISLAFNTFPIGDIGDENELTALRLEK